MYFAGCDLTSATGYFGFRGLDGFIQNGDLSLNFFNSSEENVTRYDINLSIGKAEMVDISIKNQVVELDTFCLGSFSVGMKYSLEEA